MHNLRRSICFQTSGSGPIYGCSSLVGDLDMTDGHFGVPGNYNEILSMQAFRGTGWTTIHLPKTTLRITANYVFMSAPRLTSLIISADHLVTITASNALGSLSGSCKVYVPNDLVISYRKASYWSAIYTRILPIIEGPSVIYGNGSYSFIPNTPFSGFTDIEWTLEENDYLSLTTEQDGSATIVASGMTSDTDTTVQLGYSFVHNGNSFTGTINIPVAYQEIIQFEDEEVKRICVNNWGGIYGSAVKIPGVPGELTMEQALGSPAKKAASVLSRLKFVTVTRTFSTTIPIYGLRYSHPGRNLGDYFVRFNTDTGHTIQVNCYYSRCWYVDGNSHSDVSSLWINLGSNKYISFFSDSVSNPYVTAYVTFKDVTGYRPGEYDGRVSALVDSNDI